MAEIDDIYNDLIMEHSMNSYNKKELLNPDKVEMGHNPNCGDEIKLEVKLKDGKIDDMSFIGHGCAISQSSTSIMIDVLKGKTIDEAKRIVKNFIRMIKREKLTKEEMEELQEAVAFKNIANMPAKVKCVLLAWHTMEKILSYM